MHLQTQHRETDRHAGKEVEAWTDGQTHMLQCGELSEL